MVLFYMDAGRKCTMCSILENGKRKGFTNLLIMSLVAYAKRAQYICEQLEKGRKAVILI